MRIFAYIFMGLTIFITVFQLALAFGAPLGEFTMGGKFPGKLPGKMRVAALIQIIILMLFAALVISKAGIALESFLGIAKIGIWFVSVFFVLGSVANLSSTSKKERFIMGPLNIIALICTFMVAIS